MLSWMKLQNHLNGALHVYEFRSDIAMCSGHTKKQQQINQDKNEWYLGQDANHHQVPQHNITNEQ